MTPPKTTRVVVCGTFTADPTVAALRFWADQLGVAWDVRIAPHGQVFQELLTPGSLVRTNGEGVNALLVRLQDWGGETAQNAGMLIDALASSRGRHTILCLCDGTVDTHAVEYARIQDALAQLPEVTVLHLAQIAAAYGVEQLHDPRSERLGHMPFTRHGYEALATAVARRLHALEKPAHKLLIVDCDNTLWGGICGEDGAAGVRLDPPYLRFQELLEAQRERGILLCICSKNRDLDVFEVFESRPDMVLRRQSFTCIKSNWRPKTENIRDIATELGLGLPETIFIDDNEVECAEVRARLPEVLTLQIPRDLQALDDFVRHGWAFDVGDTTETGRQRAALYDDHLQRERSRDSAGSLAEFIANLELVVTFETLSEANLARVSELTKRTNQFNFTTRRRSPSELRAYSEAPGHGCLCVSVRDRFGDYGLVGVVLYEARDGSTWVDTFLLSCRVLGRGVEHRIVVELARQAAGGGGDRSITFELEKTPRNEPAFTFLSALGEPHHAGADGCFHLELPLTTAAAVRHDPDDLAGSAARSIPGARSTSPSSASASTGSGTASCTASGTLSRVTTDRNAAARSYARIAELASIETIDAAIRAWSAPVESPSPSQAGTEPRDDLERALASMFADALNRESVTIDESFLDLGGHSLIAVRVFADIERQFGVELPISELFDAPDVRRLAQRVRHHLERPATTNYRHLVPMNSVGGPDRPILFVAAGHFGNVLNFAPLAKGLDGRVSAYGLQAAGLLVGDEPHRTIEAAAAGYLVEMRSLQPTGPYHLAGFSTGGVLAAEMAHQLRDAGAEVGLLAMFDSDTPESTRLSKFQRLGYTLRTRGVVRLAGGILRRLGRRVGVVRPYAPNAGPAPIRSRQRLDAVREAMDGAAARYQSKPLDLDLHLLRATSEPSIRIGWRTSVRVVGGEPHLVIDPDHGWSRWFRRVIVTDIPGNHGGMLEAGEALARVILAGIGSCQTRSTEAGHTGEPAPGGGPNHTGDSA